MARLPRPYIPRDVRLRVLFRQLGWAPKLIDEVIEQARGPGKWGELLDYWLPYLAEKLECKVEDLELDHDPALENRMQIIRDGKVIGYSPAANDPDFLLYRTAQKHKIKTLVRGDGAQRSDASQARYLKRVAVNRGWRERKRPKQKIPQRKRPWPKRKLNWRKP